MGRPVVGVIVALEDGNVAGAISFAFNDAVDLRQPAAVLMKGIVAQGQYMGELGDSIVIMGGDCTEVVVVFGRRSGNVMLITDLLAEIALQAGFSMKTPQFLPLKGFAATMRARFGGQKEQL